MANIKETLALRAAREEASKPAEMPEWQKKAEEALKANPSISRASAPTFAESIAKTGYPKNLTFCGVCVHIDDEEDLAKFWKSVYANLTKSEYAQLSDPEHEPITERQVASALYRSYQRVGLAEQLVENGVDSGAMEFESEGAYYVLAAGMVIALDGHVVCDVSDVQTPFGPEEWIEVANRIRSAKGPDLGELDYPYWIVKVLESAGFDYDSEAYEDEGSAREAFEYMMGEIGVYEIVLIRRELLPDGTVGEVEEDRWEA